MDIWLPLELENIFLSFNLLFFEPRCCNDDVSDAFWDKNMIEKFMLGNRKKYWILSNRSSSDSMNYRLLFPERSSGLTRSELWAPRSHKSCMPQLLCFAPVFSMESILKLVKEFSHVARYKVKINVGCFYTLPKHCAPNKDWEYNFIYSNAQKLSSDLWNTCAVESYKTGVCSVV